MTSGREPTLILPIAVTLTVLLALYVGAYYWAVSPAEGVPYYPAHWDRRAWYRRERWEAFFSPIHWLDRRIRPHVWEPKSAL